MSATVADSTPFVSNPPRKPWATPELTEYGSVAKLTQTGGSTRNEATNPMARMSCL
jgi:hypothetical protein